VDAHAEAAAITRAEVADVQGVQPIAGAEAFLSALPQNRWAVVTSAPLALATRRLEAAGLPRPSILITAEDVRNGKPAPDCFILAAERLSVSPSRCLAFEDADAGIRAATAAGCEVLVITETHRHKMPSPYAQVENYKGLQPQLGSGRLKLASK
jgi:sugar-phosphatase